MCSTFNVQILYRLVELEENEEERVSQEDTDLLRLEQNTWGLLQALMPCVVLSSPSAQYLKATNYSARKTEPLPLPSPRDLLSENPYTPTSTLAQAIMNSSPLLSELIVVREWLHDTAPQPQHPEATTGYWKFTKHSIMQALRTGSAYRDGLVREMDPDAMNRGDGRALAADDTVGFLPNLLRYNDVKCSRRIARIMKRALHMFCMRMSVQESSKMQSNCAERHTSHGGQPASEDRCCSSGVQLVYLPR